MLKETDIQKVDKLRKQLSDMFNSLDFAKAFMRDAIYCSEDLYNKHCLSLERIKGLLANINTQLLKDGIAIIEP